MLLKEEYESIRVINTAELVVLREFYMHIPKSFTLFSFFSCNMLLHITFQILSVFLKELGTQILIL